MKKSELKLLRRRAIAGIVAAVILFAMLFTTGLAFFLFLNSQNLRYSEYLTSRANNIQNAIAEDLAITGAAPNGYLVFTINNVAGVPSTIIAVMITDSSGYVFAYYNSTNSNIGLPIPLNPGSVSSQITSNVQYVSGNEYVIKVLTQNGNIFSTTYPPTATTLAAQALSSGAIGDLYLSFQSYTWYQVTTCSTSSSGYCLGQGASAFAIPSAYATTNVAFSVIVTDLNPNQLNITLDPYTQIAQFFPPSGGKGGGTARETSWFIVNVANGNQISASYSPIVLLYDQPTTLYFASSQAITGTNGFSPQSVSGSNNQVSPGTTAIVFIVSHGWKGDSYNAIISKSPPPYNYGQNSPYVTTLYY